MLHLIPASLHRAGLRAAHAARKQWWRVSKPDLSGVTIIARNGEGHVLLVRHTYGNRAWSLPGGGIRAGEEPEAAAVREFAEELDCAIYALGFVGVHEAGLYGARVSRHIFSGEVVDLPRPDRREIAEVRFFAVDALPQDCVVTVSQHLAMLEQR